MRVDNNPKPQTNQKQESDPLQIKTRSKGSRIRKEK